MGGACNTFGEEERCIQGFGGETLEDRGVDGKIILRHLQEVGMGGTDWIDLVQDRERWRVLVNAVRNRRVPESAGNFLTSAENRLASQERLCSMQ